MECTLDEKVDQKVCEYLREHHAEYQNTKQKINTSFFYQIVKSQHCISAKLPIINANMLEEWLRVLYNIYRTFGQPVCRFQTAQETEC